MRYRLLGRSGLRVSELCLGAMTFGEEWGIGADAAECRRVFDLFASRGGNFIDTANKYTEGTSERWVGEFVGADRDRFVVATKYTLTMDPADPNACGNHRKNLMRSIEGSLRRLGMGHVDLLWVHAWDGFTPPEEICRGLDDLVRSGKVHYVGISDTPAWRVSQMNTLAELRGWSPFVGLQLKYNLVDRTAERDLLPMAKAFGLGVTVWGALQGGLLTGKHTGGPGAGDTKRAAAVEARLTERNRAIVAAVVAVAAEHGRSPAQVALAWLRSRGPSILPIVGARTARQMEDNLGCLDLVLAPEQLARLGEASALEPGFPHDFLNNEGVLPNLYGDTLDRIDAERAG